jgi:hypothetical protein
MKKVALVYDLDLTLTEEYQQIPFLRDFAEGIRKKHGITDLNKYLSTLCSKIDIGVGAMEQLLIDSRDIFDDTTRDRFLHSGKGVRLAPGQPKWFPRIDDYARTLNLELGHHVISAGVKPIIEGMAVAPYLSSIHAGEYIYGPDGKILRIKSIVDPYNKRSSLTRICKGANAHRDIPIEEYEVRYDHVIVIGDGQSDQPIINFVHERGGWGIGVYRVGDLADKERARRDLGGYAHFIVPRDYSQGELLEVAVRKCLQGIASLECNFDFRLVHALKLGHLNNCQLEDLTQKHLDGCADCQVRNQPTVYY